MVAEVREAYRLHEDLSKTFDQKLEMLYAVEATQCLADLVGRSDFFAVRRDHHRDRIRDEHQQELKRVGDEDLLRISCATTELDW